jgi:uncharacterized protein (TIGR02145 family)
MIQVLSNSTIRLLNLGIIEQEPEVIAPVTPDYTAITVGDTLQEVAKKVAANILSILRINNYTNPLNITYATSEISLNNIQVTITVAGGLGLFSYELIKDSVVLATNTTGIFNVTEDGYYTLTVTDLVSGITATEIIDVWMLQEVEIEGQVWAHRDWDLFTTPLGEEIPEITSNTAWKNSVTPARCAYDNSTANIEPYGLLYNYYAAAKIQEDINEYNRNNPNNPWKWRIPTQADWDSLIIKLGASVAGGKLKETGFTYWDSPNTGATNEVGYSGRGGGIRSSLTGVFSAQKLQNLIWSISKSRSEDQAMRVVMTNNRSDIQIVTSGKKVGGGIRFIKNKYPRVQDFKNNWNYPDNFSWNPDYGIFWNNDRWDLTANPKNYKIVSTNKYYIGKHGNDANDGNSYGTAKLTLSGLFTQIIADEVTDADIVIYSGTYEDEWHSVFINIDFNLIANGEVTISSTSSTLATALIQNINCYIEGVIFSGGKNALRLISISDNLCTLNNCQFIGANGDGLEARDFSGCVQVFECRALNNVNDGFNYHNLTKAHLLKVLEYKCEGSNNGTTSTDNGSTCHDGGEIIRIQGLYRNNLRNIHDINTGTRSLLMSCNVDTSRGAANEDDSFNVGIGSAISTTGTEMWIMDSNIEGGSIVDLNLYKGGVLYIDKEVPNSVLNGDYFYLL